MRRSAWMVALAMVLASALVYAAAPQAAEKPAKPKAKKVWTNDDLDRLPRWRISTASSEPAPAKAAKAEGEEAESPEAAGEETTAEKAAGEKPAPKPPKEQDAEYWRRQLAPLRQQLQDVEAQMARIRSSSGQA